MGKAKLISHEILLNSIYKLFLCILITRTTAIY